MQDELPEFFLLNGFLGSGKTTLLLSLLAETGFENTGVIVNEVGEINIDGSTVTAAQSGLQLAQLSNGCVCCSMMSDLPVTVAALMDENERLGRPPLRRIILETSGLSRPAPIIRQLLGLPLPFRISVVATYDCVNGALAQDEFEEAAAQLAAAQTIVLTKLDCVSNIARAEAVRAVEGINPLARIVDEVERGRRVRKAFKPTTVGIDRLAERIAQDEPVSSPHERIGVFLARAKDAVPGDDLFEWLDNMAALLGPRLLRTKGIVAVQGQPGALLVQSVGTVFDPPRRMAQPPVQNAMVIIARDVDLEELGEIGPDLSLEFRDTCTRPAFVCVATGYARSA
ncbi:GTP-binding protein [Aquamicrobium sp. LC103]|uniref:CobW family GTP-binding protein n=1 Tax=Aquamicrobium sp. LC103 TaxID=1120658 RepID=UPI00063E8111|nr:GTP-binding protein [Aquamicrobium sp. LC103]